MIASALDRTKDPCAPLSLDSDETEACLSCRSYTYIGRPFTGLYCCAVPCRSCQNSYRNGSYSAKKKGECSISLIKYFLSDRKAMMLCCHQIRVQTSTLDRLGRKSKSLSVSQRSNLSCMQDPHRRRINLPSLRQSLQYNLHLSSLRCINSRQIQTCDAKNLRSTRCSSNPTDLARRAKAHLFHIVCIPTLYHAFSTIQRWTRHRSSKSMLSQSMRDPVLPAEIWLRPVAVRAPDRRPLPLLCQVLPAAWQRCRG